MPTQTHALMTNVSCRAGEEYFATPRSFALHEETRGKADLSLAENKEENQKTVLRFRYRGSPEEIQGEN